MQRTANDAGGREPNFRFVAIRIFLINLLVLTVAYSLYWYWVANAVELEIMQWVQRQRLAGQTIEFAHYERGGFPFSVRLTFHDVSYAPDGTDSPWSYHVDGVTLSHSIGEPSKLGIALSGSEELTFGSGNDRVVYGGGFEAASGTLEGGGWLPNGSVSARELSMIDVDSQHGLAVRSLTLAAKGNAAAPTSPEEAGYTLDVKAAGLSFPGLSSTWPFGPKIGEMTLSANVMGALQRLPWRDMAKTWREIGGAVEVTRMHLSYGPATADGTGTVTLDRNGQPEAAFSFLVDALPQLLDGFVDKGMLSGATAAAIKGLVMVGAKTGADGKTRVRLPLTLQDRVLSVGPVPLVTLPAIHWGEAHVPPVDGS